MRLPRWFLVCLAVACGGGSDSPSTTPTKASPPPVVDERGIPPELTCPGGPGCEAAEGALRVGVAARPITPLVLETYQDNNNNGDYDKGDTFEDTNGNGKLDGIWLAGFGTGRAATSIHDDSWARVLTFSQGDVSVAMVSLDLVGLFHDSVLKIRQAARDRGLDFDHIMVSTTHVHETRDTMGMWGPSALETGFDPEYIQFVVDRTIEALVEAKKGERVARARLARAEAPELVNDTRSPKVFDPGIQALQFLDEADAPFATAIVWGNHPEALGSKNTALTSDYPHYLRSAIEARYPNSTAVFFNGCLGGLTTTIGVVGCPDAEGKETCPQGTFERAAYIGEGAAKATIAALDGPDAKKIDALSLGVRRRSVLLSTSNAGLALLVDLGVLPRQIHHLDGRKLSAQEQDDLSLSDVLRGPYRVSSEVNAIEVGPVIFGTVPGELYSELWMEGPGGQSLVEQPEGADFPDAPREPPLASHLPKDRTRIVINNANDAVGYILPKPQWDVKIPRAYKPDGQYGEENSLGEDTAATLSEVYRRLYGP